MSPLIRSVGLRRGGSFTPPISPVRVFDTFTGANGTLITAHAPDIAPVGSAWAQGRGTDVLELQGNMLANPSGSSGECIINSGVSDCVITAKLKLGPTGPSAITFRAQQNGGVWDVWRAAIDTGLIQIYEITAGVFTPRASQNLAISRGVTYLATVTLSGPNITFNVAGVGTINYSSSVRQAMTRHGLQLDVGATADDFKVEKP